MKNLKLIISVLTLITIVVCALLFNYLSKENEYQKIKTDIGKNYYKLVLLADRYQALNALRDYSKDMTTKTKLLKCTDYELKSCNEFKNAIAQNQEELSTSENTGMRSVRDSIIHDKIINSLYERNIIENLMQKLEFSKFNQEFPIYSKHSKKIDVLLGSKKDVLTEYKSIDFSNDVNSYYFWTPKDSTYRSKDIFTRMSQGVDLDCQNFFAVERCNVSKEELESLILKVDTKVYKTEKEYNKKSKEIIEKAFNINLKIFNR